MELPIFDQVGELVRAMTSDVHGVMHYRAHRGGVKVWFGPAKPLREHYEAQFIPRRFIDDVDGVALEIGFHAEHRDRDQNDQVMEKLLRGEKAWRKELGAAAEAGGFFGRPDDWSRISETWLDFTFDGGASDNSAGAEATPGDGAFELASRLVDYIDAIEPLRTA